MCKISVIIPVYNGAKTIEKCVQSILSQSLRELEVLLINDGSSDNSAELCDRLVKKDGRIRAFNIENSGPATARNLGINEAKGEFLAFCDDDDFLEQGALSYMYENIGDNDVLCCGLIFDFEGEMERTVLPEQERLTSTSLMSLKARNLLDTMCNKLYRTEFLRKNNLRLPDGELYEDTEFNQRLFLCSPKVVFCKKAFYHYVQKRGSSITRRFNPGKLALMKARSNGLFELEKLLGGNGSIASMYHLRTLLSCFTDYYIKGSGYRGKQIRSIIKDEINNASWKKALYLAKPFGKTDMILKFTAEKGALFISVFCWLSYILKYKMRKIFFKLR